MNEADEISYPKRSEVRLLSLWVPGEVECVKLYYQKHMIKWKERKERKKTHSQSEEMSHKAKT